MSGIVKGNETGSVPRTGEETSFRWESTSYAEHIHSPGSDNSEFY